MVGFDTQCDLLVSRVRAPAEQVELDADLSRAIDRAKQLGQAHAWPEQVVDRSADAWELPRQLRDYRLIEVLGRGGMGIVYKALHTKLDKVVALKVLTEWHWRDPESVARFQREMKAVGRLDAPHIVRALDAGEHDGTHFLVMEYIEGATVSQIVRQHGALPAVDACEIVRQAAIGLDHAHASHLVHRDIKPSNLMVTPEGQVKVLDMGLARLADSSGVDAAGMEQEELTAGGQVMGTLEYMAPEQFSNSREADARADVYALGATLYKLLAGRAPFARNAYDSPFEMVAAVANDAPLSLDDAGAHVSLQLASLVERMLAKDPNIRTQSAREVAQTLAPFSAGSDLAALLPDSTEPARTGLAEQDLNQPAVARRRAAIKTVGRRRWIALASGGVVAAVLVAIALSVAPPKHATVESRDQPTEERSDLPPVPPPVANHSLSFNEFMDVVLIPDVTLDRCSEATIEAYLRPREYDRVAGGFAIGGLPLRLGTFMQPGSRMLAFCQGAGPEGEGQVDSYGKIEKGRWTHVALVWSGDKLHLFVDGQRKTIKKHTLKTLRSENRLLLGTHVYSQVPGKHVRKSFRGEVDEVRISSVARYDEDFIPSERFESDEHTLALYHLDEGQGGRITDSSGNGRHGKIIGAEWWNRANE